MSTTGRADLGARVAAALDASPGSIVLLLDDGFRIIWASRAGTGRLGGPERLVGRPAAELLHPNDLELAAKALEHHTVYADRYPSVDGTAPPQPSSIRVLGQDGAWLWAEVVLHNHLADPEIGALVVHLRLGTDRPLLAHAVEMISDGEALPEILSVLADVIELQLVGSTAAVVWWEGTAPSVAPSSAAARRPEVLPGLHPIDLCKRVRRSEQPIVVSGLGGHPSVLEPASRSTATALDARHVLLVPVEGTTPGDVIAVLVVWSPSPVPPMLGRQMPLALTSELVSLAITDGWLRRRLRADAESDPLTGVHNRSGFRRVLADAIGRGAFPLGVVFVDVDDFKAVNDRHGHLAGDRVLVTIAARLSDLDSGAEVGRMGGDEFALLATRRTPEQVADLAERAVTGAREPIRIGNELALVVPVTAGYAVATAPGHVASLLARADDALMAGKRGGKDRAIGDEGPAADTSDGAR
jgi:diguanylate cyclase (GGDEF)-like protein